MKGEEYKYIHKHIKNVFMIGNYELEEFSIFLGSIIIVYIFQEELKLGFMVAIIYLGYEGMLWLHELKATNAKSFKYHLAYKYGLINTPKFPKSYIKEFTS